MSLPKYRIKAKLHFGAMEYIPQKRFLRFFWLDLDGVRYFDEGRARDAINIDKRWYEQSTAKTTYKYY